MSKRNLVPIVILAAVVLLVGLFAATQGGDAGGADEGSVKIGVVAPLTGSAALAGTWMQDSTELAVSEINDAGGIMIDGVERQLEVVYGDDQGTIEGAVAATRRLITQDNVVAIVGYALSTPTLAALQVAQVSEVPTIDTVASTIEISERVAEGNAAGVPQYVYQLSPTSFDRGEADAAAAFHYLKPQRPAALLQNTDLGQDLEVAYKEFQEENAPESTWVAVEYFDETNTEFTSLLAKIRRADPDVLFVSMVGAATDAFIQQYAEAKLDIPVVTDGSEFAEPSFLVEHQEEMEGWINNIVWSPAPVTPKTIPFADAYEDRFEERPGYVSAQQYEGVLMMAEAIEAASSLDSRRIKQALDELSFVGVTGELDFDAEAQKIDRELVVAQSQDGAHVIIWPLQAVGEQSFRETSEE